MFAVLAPKRKSGRETHRTRPRAFEQAVNYTERAGFKQPRTVGHKDAENTQIFISDSVCFVPLCGYEFSFAFTTSLTIRPSAFLPAKAACAAFITLPMSFMEFAPVSAMIAVTACSISSCDAACGR